MKKILLTLILLIPSLCFGGISILGPDAPWQEGFGMDNYGGSGRHLGTPASVICEVNTLSGTSTYSDNDDSDGKVVGSFRYCCEDYSPSSNQGTTVTFIVSGNIDTLNDEINISRDYITIAGQTAPSPGIAIVGKGIGISSGVDHILIQHLRFRSGDEYLWEQLDAGWVNEGGNVYSHSTNSNFQVYWDGSGLDTDAWYDGDQLTPEYGSCPGALSVGEFCISGIVSHVGTIYVDVGEDPATGIFIYNTSKWDGPDAFTINQSNVPPTNIVIANCSIAYGVDIPIVTGANYITFIDNIIADSLYSTFGTKGPHPKGMLIKSDAGDIPSQSVMVARNLFYNCLDRNPRASDDAQVAVVNNLIMDWYTQGINVDYRTNTDPRLTAIGNYFVNGDRDERHMYLMTDSSVPGAKIYIDNTNYIEGSIVTDPWNAHPDIYQCNDWSTCSQMVPAINRAATAADAIALPSGYTPLSAAAARTYILANVGARPNDRDTLDTDLISDAASDVDRDPNYTSAFSNSQCSGSNKPFPCCTGVGTGTCPDVTIQSLDENTVEHSYPTDWNDVQPSGYTKLEEWLRGYEFPETIVTTGGTGSLSVGGSGSVSVSP